MGLKYPLIAVTLSIWKSYYSWTISVWIIQTWLGHSCKNLRIKNKEYLNNDKNYFICKFD